MKNEKLTVLDFKKDQLVNLNEEDMMAVKGGESTLPCVGVGIAFGTLAYQFAKGESYVHCDKPELKPYNISEHQYSEISCASVPPVVIKGYQ